MSDIDADIDLGDDMPDPSKIADIFSPLKLNLEIGAALSKLGWDSTFWDKYAVVVIGYTAIMVEQAVTEAIAEADPDIQKSFDEIDEMDLLDEDAKREFKEAILGLYSGFYSLSEGYRNAIHPDDFELVKNTSPAETIDRGGRPLILIKTFPRKAPLQIHEGALFLLPWIWGIQGLRLLYALRRGLCSRAQLQGDQVQKMPQVSRCSLQAQKDQPPPCCRLCLFGLHPHMQARTLYPSTTHPA